MCFSIYCFSPGFSFSPNCAQFNTERTESNATPTVRMQSMKNGFSFLSDPFSFTRTVAPWNWCLVVGVVLYIPHTEQPVSFQSFVDGFWKVEKRWYGEHIKAFPFSDHIVSKGNWYGQADCYTGRALEGRNMNFKFRKGKNGIHWSSISHEGAMTKCITAGGLVVWFTIIIARGSSWYKNHMEMIPTYLFIFQQTIWFSSHMIESNIFVLIK